MTVETKKVTGRRKLQFDSLDKVLAEAERLAESEVRTIGNWSLGQILDHLAKAVHASIDGMQMKIPWIMKKFFGLIMSKEKMLTQPLPAGFKIPKKGQPQFSPAPSITTEQGLTALREALARNQRESSRAEHPVFGNLPREEWDQFHMRHAELHLSFVVPAE